MTVPVQGWNTMHPAIMAAVKNCLSIDSGMKLALLYEYGIACYLVGRDSDRAITAALRVMRFVREADRKAYKAWLNVLA